MKERESRGRKVKNDMMRKMSERKLNDKEKEGDEDRGNEEEM